MSREATCDILIVGGGTGGCAAAMAACSMGMRVIMTEETDWIGGQLTSQAVPPDEHPWIESHGCTWRYRQFRNLVRDHYRRNYPLTASARHDPKLNPGNGWVSRICFEPRVGLAALWEQLGSYVSRGLLDVQHRTIAVASETEGDHVRSVTLKNLDTGNEQVVNFQFVLDATELGDLLPMTGTEYRVGSESQSEFGELHAPEVGSNEDIQGFTWCMSVGFDPGGNHTIEKPENYDFWRNYVPPLEPAWPGKLLDWTVIDAITLQPRKFWLFGVLGLFTYRRIIDGSLFDASKPVHDVSIINWVQNDHFFRVIDMPDEHVQATLRNAKLQSLALLYWLQTEAERNEGGYGYPELFLAPYAVGTADGLAMAPYHREARRIKAEFTVTEKHVGVLMRENCGSSERFEDSVGVGAYRIDLHPSASGRNSVDLAAYPFQIPLKSLIPQRVDNLLAACKNLGVTHITNGCYRLHPVEWNIGEAAGLVAAMAIQKNTTPRAIANQTDLLLEFQSLCIAQGFELDWPKTKGL